LNPLEIATNSLYNIRLSQTSRLWEPEYRRLNGFIANLETSAEKKHITPILKELSKENYIKLQVNPNRHSHRTSLQLCSLQVQYQELAVVSSTN